MWQQGPDVIFCELRPCSTHKIWQPGPGLGRRMWSLAKPSRPVPFFTVAEVLLKWGAEVSTQECCVPAARYIFNFIKKMGSVPYRTRTGTAKNWYGVFVTVPVRYGYGTCTVRTSTDQSGKHCIFSFLDLFSIFLDLNFTVGNYDAFIWIHTITKSEFVHIIFQNITGVRNLVRQNCVDVFYKKLW